MELLLQTKAVRAAHTLVYVRMDSLLGFLKAATFLLEMIKKHNKAYAVHTVHMLRKTLSGRQQVEDIVE